MSIAPMPPRIERFDWYLQLFVDFANEGSLRIPVTLSTGGLLVSGELIGGREYFAGFAEELADALQRTDEGVANSYRELLSGFGTDVYGDVEDNLASQNPDGDDPEEDSGPHYVHLKDARIFHPGGDPVPSNRGVLWRARLEAVDGFFLGTLASATASED